RALDFINVRELVDEFARAIRQELDYRLEARNAQTLHRHFVGHPHVRIPRVYWSYTRARVLTLEFIEGTKLGDLEATTYTREARRDRPAPSDPRGLRADLRAQPAAADAIPHPRQGDRDARHGRNRALPGLQRLRGREAVRAEPHARPLHAPADARARAPRVDE